MSFKVKFWGVRGSIPCPGTQHAFFGGNTSCVEIAIDGERFILDGGSGIRNLGHWLLRKDVRRATIPLSHTHWDHIHGLPFFSPAFHEECSLRVMAGHLGAFGGIAGVFAGQLKNPYFPVPLEAMKASLTFEDFAAGDTLRLGRNATIGVRTTSLNHPNGATGYRFEHDGRSLCYVTDTEHRKGRPDQNVLGLVEGADLLIYDSTYTDKEFETKIGWGHSTWQEGVRIARAANVSNLAIFHHDPDHDDATMKQIARAAKREFAGAFVAREGMQLGVGTMAPRPRVARPARIGRRAGVAGPVEHQLA